MIRSIRDMWEEIQTLAETLFAGDTDRRKKIVGEIDEVKTLVTAESSVVECARVLGLIRTDVRRYAPSADEAETHEKLLLEMRLLGVALTAMRELYEHQRKS